MNVPIPEVAIRPGIFYLHPPHHRNGAPGSSQWLIGMAEERMCFTVALDREWIAEREGWGLHAPNGQVLVLGRSADGQRNLSIAKFVDGNASDHWHGYPVDHQRKPSDIPGAAIVWDWQARQLITLPQTRRLLRGLPCAL